MSQPLFWPNPIISNNLIIVRSIQTFFDGIEEKLSSGVKAEEIGYQLAFSKQELRKAIKEYPEKEVSSIHTLASEMLAKNYPLFQPDLDRLIHNFLLYSFTTVTYGVMLYTWLDSFKLI